MGNKSCGECLEYIRPSGGNISKQWCTNIHSCPSAMTMVRRVQFEREEREEFEFRKRQKMPWWADNNRGYNNPPWIGPEWKQPPIGSSIESKDEGLFDDDFEGVNGRRV